MPPRGVKGTGSIQNMKWYPFKGGTTIGRRGSEEGVIVRDEEHEAGARITLERNCQGATFAITCGIYGWGFDTQFFSSPQEAEAEYERMRAGLAEILDRLPFEDDPDAENKSREVSQALADFIQPGS